MTTLAPVPDQESSDRPAGQTKLFEVGGDAPNIVALSFTGRQEGVPKLKKGEQYTFEVTATVTGVNFTDKRDGEGFVEKVTRKQVLKIDEVSLVE